jgi:hypothetical protein
MGRVTRRVLGISPQEASFARRGFHCESRAVRERLEEVGRSFAAGYNLALAETGGAEALAARLEAGLPAALRGFGYEGAAMGLALLDALTPWRRDRLRRFLAGPGDAHIYIVHVGAGWALARLPWLPSLPWLPRAVEGRMARLGLDPFLAWLALDGYGFHQGYFHAPLAIGRQQVPRRLRGYARRAFDHGLGRSLWFSEGADPDRIGATVARFPAARHGDLWAGVGLAAAYAGGAGADDLATLRRAAGAHRPALAQGAAFAAKARLRAGLPTPDNSLACAALCGMTAEEAAAVTDRMRPAAWAAREAAPDAVPPFEVWRQRIQQVFLAQGDQGAQGAQHAQGATA